MRIILCLSFLFLMLPTAFAQHDSVGGGHTGNGGGPAELNLAQAWLNLESSFSKLQGEFAQEFSDAELSFIDAVRENHKREPKQLVFKSWDGEVFKTGTAVGSEIVVNSDRLQNLTISGALDLVIDIVATRYEIAFDLKELKLKIRDLFAKNVVVVSLKAYGRPHLGFEFFELNPSRAYLTSERTKIGVAAKIRSQLLCPDDAVPGNFRLFGLHHASMGNFDAASKSVSAVFEGDVDYPCGRVRMTGKLTVTGVYQLHGRTIDERWYLDPAVSAGLGEENVSVSVFDIR